MSELNTSGRMDRKKEETRQKVIGAALALIDAHGYDAVTMEQIAEKADIAKGTLYNYYPVKEAIIADHIDRLSVARNAERIERLKQLPDTRSRITLSLRELLEAIQGQAELFEKYFIYRVQRMITLDRRAARVSGLHALERAIIEMGQNAGEIRSDIDPNLLEALFEFSFIVAAQAYYQNPAEFDMERTVTQCVDLFLRGAGVQK